MLEKRFPYIEVRHYQKGDIIPWDSPTMQNIFSVLGENKIPVLLLEDAEVQQGSPVRSSYKNILLTGAHEVAQVSKGDPLCKVCSAYITKDGIEINASDNLYKTFNYKNFLLRIHIQSRKETVLQVIATGKQQIPEMALQKNIVQRKVTHRVKKEKWELRCEHEFALESCDGEIPLPSGYVPSYENPTDLILYRTSDNNYRLFSSKTWERVLEEIDIPNSGPRNIKESHKQRASAHQVSGAQIEQGKIVLASTRMQTHIKGNKNFKVQIYN